MMMQFWPQCLWVQNFIERHLFIDSTKHTGPDHSFSTDIKSFKKLVNKVRELELMLGDGVKRIEKNEKERL